MKKEKKKDECRKREKWREKERMKSDVMKSMKILGLVIVGN